MSRTNTSSNDGRVELMLGPLDRHEVSRRLSRIIRTTRRLRELSISELSRQTEISRRTIGDIEKGEGYLPSLFTLMTIARSLGLTMGEVGRELELPADG